MHLPLAMINDSMAATLRKVLPRPQTTQVSDMRADNCTSEPRSAYVLSKYSCSRSYMSTACMSVASLYKAQTYNGI